MKIRSTIVVPSSERQLTDLVGLLSRRSPPAQFEYSNSNYLLHSASITRTVTGKFHADYIRENIFEPLGMKTARIASDAEMLPNRSRRLSHEQGSYF